MDLEEAKHDEVPNCEIVCNKELVDCRCSELEERSKKAEGRCVELELDIQKKKSENEALEAKLRALEVDRLAIEYELKVLKRENDEFKKRVSGVEGESKVSSGSERIVDLTTENEDEDDLIQLLIENKVLECEKKIAESKVEVWKEKLKELVSRVLELDENPGLRCVEWPLIGGTKMELGVRNVNSHEVGERKEAIESIKLDGTNLDYMQNKSKVESLVEVGSTIWHSPGKEIRDLEAAGTPFNDSPYKHDPCIKEEKKGVCLEYDRRARKQLTFEEEKSPIKKLAPSTTGGARPASLGIIDVSDSEDEQTTYTQLPTSHNECIRKVDVSGDSTVASSVGSEKEAISGNSLEQTHYDENDEEDVDACKENLSFAPTPRRKRASNIVTSDSESDEDDIPISKLKRMCLREKVPDQVVSNLNDYSVTATTSLGENVKGSVTPPRRPVR